ncbi:MAG: hypothetical protein CMF59_16840 [Leptospiraceae bacterium]|nr:hypothetical protein [Leptospiraceae bacterium]
MGTANGFPIDRFSVRLAPEGSSAGLVSDAASTMDYSSLNHLTLVSPAVSGFLTLYFLQHGKYRRNLWLCFATAILTLTLLVRHLFEIQSAALPYVPFLLFPLTCLIGPALHRYVGLTLGSITRGPLLCGLVLGLFAFCTHLIVFINLPEARSPEKIVNQAGLLGLYTSFYLAAVTAIQLVYFAAAGVALYRNSSSLDNPVAKWCWLLIAAFSAYFLSYFLFGTLTVLNIIPIPAHFLEVILAVAVLFGMLHYLMSNPDVLRERSESTRYAKQSLTSDQATEYRNRLESYMETAKPYLQEEIGLNRLAELTEIPPHHLSMVINTELSMNFFAFINEYRVKEARKLIENPERKDHTLLAIAFEAGFQSKASFNAAFKKHTGMAPGEYRRRLDSPSDLQ